MEILQVAHADKNHLDDIVKVENLLFPSEPFSRAQYRYLMRSPNADVLVCLLDGKIIGHGVTLKKRLGNGRSHGRIYSICILRKYRRKGYAGALLEAMEQNLKERGVAFITLETHKDHESSISFFMKHGYSKTKDLPGYYKDGDGIGMRKELGDTVSSILNTAHRLRTEDKKRDYLKNLNI